MDYERFMRTCGVLRHAYDAWDSLYWALVLEDMSATLPPFLWGMTPTGAGAMRALERAEASVPADEVYQPVDCDPWRET